MDGTAYGNVALASAGAWLLFYRPADPVGATV